MEGLLAVLAAARTGAFMLAAEELGLTHGAISRRVAGVEAWLGTAVFERHGRGVRLTPAGRRFTTQVGQALESIERTSDRWRPGQGRATVRLSVVPSFAKLWLLPRLAGLIEALPSVRIELIVEHRVLDLDANEVDLVVRYGRGNWPGLAVRQLFAETLVPAASPDLARRLGPTPNAEAIARLPLIHDSDIGQWRAWLADAGLAYRPRQFDFRFEDYDLALAAAEASLGIVLMRLPFAQGWLDSGALVFVANRASTNPRAHYLAHRREERREAVLRLAEMLVQGVGRPGSAM